MCNVRSVSLDAKRESSDWTEDFEYEERRTGSSSMLWKSSVSEKWRGKAQSRVRNECRRGLKGFEMVWRYEVSACWTEDWYKETFCALTDKLTKNTRPFVLYIWSFLLLHQYKFAHIFGRCLLFWKKFMSLKAFEVMPRTGHDNYEKCFFYGSAY